LQVIVDLLNEQFGKYFSKTAKLAKSVANFIILKYIFCQNYQSKYWLFGFQNIPLNIEETMAVLTRCSFDEYLRQPIFLLGGIRAIAELIQVNPATTRHNPPQPRHNPRLMGYLHSPTYKSEFCVSCDMMVSYGTTQKLESILFLKVARAGERTRDLLISFIFYSIS
jgi:hypothetical protein